MLCDNCKEKNATVMYTEIINGEKKEMHLCEECSHKLGIDNISFNMPINFSSFFGGLLDDFGEDEFMPLLQSAKELKCDNCNLTYDDFLKEGKFGCEECYSTFSSKIDSLLKRIHGDSKYVGRKALNSGAKTVKNDAEKTEKRDVKETKLEKLQKDLKKAISEERYEDAAKLRDEIKKIDKKDKKE